MFNLFIVTIFLIASPVFGFVKTLFQRENNCYSGCYSNYATNLAELDACKNGCDFKLQKENCVDQCKLLFIDAQIQANCVAGCSVNQPERKETKQISIEDSEEKPALIIRYRHRPLLPLPFFNHDPAKAFNDAIKQLREQSKSDNSGSIAELLKDIPLLNSPDEENKNRSQKILILHEDSFDSLQQLMKYIQKQSKLPVWSLIIILILSLAIFRYMIISLCRNKSKHHNLFIHDEQAILEKKILQPDTSIKIEEKL